MVNDGANARALVAFAMLGCAGVLLLGRLAYLQGGRAAANRKAVDRQRERTEELPSPRGTIVDRSGELLAYDRPVVAVRSEAIAVVRDGHEDADFDVFAGKLASDLAYALCADPNRLASAATRSEVREQLRNRIARSPRKPVRAATRRPTSDHRVRVDFLVAGEIDSAGVLERLERLERNRSYLYLHRMNAFARTYPEREFTYGVVGIAGQLKVSPGRSVPVYQGMEALQGLLPGTPGHRSSWQDSVARRYWTRAIQVPEPPTVLQTTLDLALQKVAYSELQLAVDKVTAEKGSPPDWGALCLADVETGAILAMASFRHGARPEAAAFSPTQCLCEPGSVVKPLVFSLALERGVLDWDGETIDCSPDGSGGWRPAGRSKPIKDSHRCGILPPFEVIAQSSNIGAAKVGSRLGREGLTEYLRRYRFGRRTATRLPGELAGVRTSAEKIRSMTQRGFEAYTAPSMSIGYEYNITPLQLLRAYVILLSGRERELRLFQRVARDGRIETVAGEPDGEEFLSADTRQKLRSAMRAVVSDVPGATGRHLAAELRRQGVRDGLIAGKTGTSEIHERRQGRRVMVRTASFVGFAPSEQPRFVVVCVLQKAEAARFWGGSYAAPSAGRLLLAALDASPRLTSSQVSAGFVASRGFGAQPAVGR